MIPSKFDLLMRFHKGVGGSIKPLKPPSPTTAAESVAKRRIEERQRNARGFGNTRVALLSQPQTYAVKSLLG